MSQKIRFYEIDLLRFLAAMAVVMFHYTFRGYAEGGYNPVQFPIIEEYSRYGYLGVHLFFIISGFVILLSAMNRSAITFAVSRFIRLYPAFWAGVTLSAVIIYLYGAPIFNVSIPQYLMNMTMISGYLGVEHIDGVYWTLLIELKFYSLIFILLLIKKIEQIEYFLAAWLGLALFNLIVPLPWLIGFFFFPEWAPLFISGSLFYLIHLKGINIARAILLLVAYALAIGYAIVEIGDLYTFYQTKLSIPITLFWITVFYLAFALVTFNKTSWIRSPWLVKIGILTYPLYLIHQNIGFIAFNLWGESINKYLLLTSLIAMMLLASWLIHIFIEKNLAKLLKNILPGQKRNSAPIQADETNKRIWKKNIFEQNIR